ncbi:unnamed protein product [Trichobilharzia regenti]|nr:unnamed protein product [Trichobilharzia regenti]
MNIRSLHRITFFLFSVDVRCSLLVDHKRVWDSPWRQPNQQCWDAKTTFSIDRGKELEVQVYWKRMVLPSNSSNSTSPSASTASTKSGSFDDSGSGLEWVLAAVNYLRLEELLSGDSRSVLLPMLPKGKVFLVVKFSDPLLYKPRCNLHRQKRLFSKRKGMIFLLNNNYFLLNVLCSAIYLICRNPVS